MQSAPLHLRHRPLRCRQGQAAQEAWAKHLGVPVEMTNSIGMKLVLIPPGEFVMGDGRTDGPVKVQITKPFYLGKVRGDAGRDG